MTTRANAELSALDIVAVTVASLAAAAIALGLRSAKPLRVRRIEIAAAFTLSFFVFTASVIGLYLPIFTLSGKIRAD